MDLQELSSEADAARALLASLRDVIGEDDDAAADAVEGETNLFKAIRDAVARVGEVEAMVDGLKAHAEALTKRRHRLEEQSGRIRTAVLLAMEAIGRNKLELDVATITRKAVPPKASVTNEADIPSRFWKTPPPKLDLAALTAALKDKEVVPGACLSNGTETIALRFQ